MSLPHAWRRLWPLALVLGGLLLALALGLHRGLSLEALAAHRAALLAAVAERPVLAALAYLGAYVAVVALSLPGGAVMTLAGGFLFGPLLGTLLAALGATAGACLLFLAARHALAEALAARGGALLARLREALRREGFWYLLAIRLLPVVPFWLANLAPALAGMPFRSYALATLVGILPATAVFAGIGAGLGQVFEAGGRPEPGLLLSPGILLPLAGLAALSLLGAWWRRRRRMAGRGRGDAGEEGGGRGHG
ncbi:TVP38/TMEM64 family protein [Crenalkalicoccus roseus]|uniref:TVP38/TMEM64 family protein n=1 Tax=Crenalkalicoccus roseus TaxID=1485588 RepID=UPI00107FD5AE|nr:VTT domain-containing protein [Crenalkalicoccus roseus]